MKIVLDTNVLVSGLLQPRGPSGAIVRQVAEGTLTLGFDARILAEYSDVLQRSKFRFEPDRIHQILLQIKAAGSLASPRPLVLELPDADDEAFLEVALASGSKYLVTGNLKHYPEEARAGISVVSPREFVEILRPLTGPFRS